MIAQLTGVVTRTEGNTIVLDVGGVGYLLSVPATVLASLPEFGSRFTLPTHLIVREDEMTLYGFTGLIEMQTFKMLLGVTGVGPKVALALLSALEAQDLARALSTNDTKTVIRVPGVGPKLAQRLCLELGDKMAPIAFEQRAARASAGAQNAQESASHEDVIAALVQFGYSRTDARKAADRVFADAKDRADVGALVTGALRWLTTGQL